MRMVSTGRIACLPRAMRHASTLRYNNETHSGNDGKFFAASAHWHRSPRSCFRIAFRFRSSPVTRLSSPVANFMASMQRRRSGNLVSMSNARTDRTRKDHQYRRSADGDIADHEGACSSRHSQGDVTLSAAHFDGEYAIQHFWQQLLAAAHGLPYLLLCAKGFCQTCCRPYDAAVGQFQA